MRSAIMQFWWRRELYVAGCRDKQHGFNPITGQEYPNMRAHGGCMGPQGKKLLPEKPTIPPEVREPQRFYHLVYCRFVARLYIQGA